MKTIPVNPNTIFALAKHIAPKNDIRYYLNGVLIESAWYYAAKLEGERIRREKKGKSK